MPDPDAVRAACRRIEAAVRADHRYAHTSHLRVHVDGRPVVDEHYRGPAVADVFSVTKTVVATVAGIAARPGLLPALADPDGVSYGFAHLRLSAASLGTLGEFWRRRGEPLVDPAFAAAMFAPQSAGVSPADRAYGFHVWIDDDLALALGWGGQCVLVAPDAVVVMTGDTGFQPGPPARDELPPDWRPGLELVREHLLPVLR